MYKVYIYIYIQIYHYAICHATPTDESLVCEHGTVCDTVNIQKVKLTAAR